MSLTISEVMQNHTKAFRPEKAGGVDAVIQFHFTGDQSGDWNLTIRDGKCLVEEGVVENPTMTLTSEGQDYIDVVTGAQDAMKAFMAGKLKLAGDLNLAMKLTQFFKMG